MKKLKTLVVSLILAIIATFTSAANSLAQIANPQQLAFDNGLGSSGGFDFGRVTDNTGIQVQSGGIGGQVASFLGLKQAVGNSGKSFFVGQSGGSKNGRVVNSQTNYFGEEDGENEENENGDQGDGNSQDN